MQTAGGTGAADVACPNDHPVALGGGASTDAGAVTKTVPLKGNAEAAQGDIANGWRGVADDNSANVQVYVICTS